MEDLYPRSPTALPPDFVRPSRRYQNHVVATTIALLLFVTLYMGTVVFLAKQAWSMYGRMGHDEGSTFLATLINIPIFAILFVLVKGLFKVQRAQRQDALEVKAEDEPELFQFIHRVAREAGAPLPHRILLVPDVNAAVTYDVSLWDLLLPTRKNLLLGLGLVQALTLDELKAVLAHEFGHFSQGSMRFGAWLYVGQQVVDNLVHARDAVDRGLVSMSHVDIRVAWIAWLIRLLVWAVRSVVDTTFTGVLIVQRALGREMEFQADRVAVSVAGSDSPVHALVRLHAADEAFRLTLHHANRLAVDRKRPDDLYAIQAHLLAWGRDVRDDPTWGEPPAIPIEAASHRVFPESWAMPPRMWSTHPPNREREDHAKTPYVPSTLDPRPAWRVFRDADAIKRKMTEHFYATHVSDGGAALTAISTPSALELVDCELHKLRFHSRYRGLYLERAPALYHEKAEGLLGTTSELPDRDLVQQSAAGLYAQAIGKLLAAWRERTHEVAMLEAVSRGVLKPTGGRLRYRGEDVPRAGLPALIEVVKREVSVMEAELSAHDTDVRRVHQWMARHNGGADAATHTMLVRFLHYVAHCEAWLDRTRDSLGHTLNVALADGALSGAERARVLERARAAWEPLAGLDRSRRDVILPPLVASRMGGTTWEAQLGEFRAGGAPNQEALGDGWLGSYDRAAGALSSTLGEVRSAALDALLGFEQTIANRFHEGVSEPQIASPRVGAVPAAYATVAPREGLSGWDRFKLGVGVDGASARFLVATGMLVPPVAALWMFGTVSVGAHNGLLTPLHIEVNGAGRDLAPGDTAWFHGLSGPIHATARTRDGQPVDTLDQDAEVDLGGDRVWNIAGAAVLYEATVVYGAGTEHAPELIGNPRWYLSYASHTLELPPQSIHTKRRGETRSMVMFIEDPVDAGVTLDHGAPADMEAWARAHALFDPVSAPTHAYAVDHLSSLTNDVVAALALARPDDVALQRARQDTADDRGAMLAEYQALAAAHPDDGDAAYLVARVMEDAVAREAAFAAGRARFPDNPWFILSEVTDLTDRGAWKPAWDLLQKIRGTPAWLARQDEAVRVARAAGLPRETWQILVARGEVPEWQVDALKVEAGGPVTAPVGSEVHAMQLLIRGDLTQAAGEAEGVWKLLVQLSEGGPHETLLDGPVEAVPPPFLPVVAAVAMAARHPKAAAWVSRLKTEVPDPRHHRVAEVELPDVAAIEEALPQISLGMRGLYLIAAVQRLGDKAPDRWRAEALALTLPWERPWLRGPKGQ